MTQMPIPALPCGTITLLCAKEVATLLRVNVRMVYRLWDSGEIANFRLGDRPLSPRRCRLSDVERYLDRRYLSEDLARSAAVLRAMALGMKQIDNAGIRKARRIAAKA